MRVAVSTKEQSGFTRLSFEKNSLCTSFFVNRAHLGFGEKFPNVNTKSFARVLSTFLGIPYIEYFGKFHLGDLPSVPVFFKIS